MNKWTFAGFSALEIGFWCMHASFISYAAAYLMSRGISGTAMSMMLSMYLLSAFIGSLFWGRICDRHRTNRKPFMLCMIVSAALMAGLYVLVGHQTAVAVIYPLLGFFFQPQAANADAWVLAAGKRDQSVFGKVRAMPSLAYAFVSAAVGYMIETFGYGSMLFGGAFFFVMAFVSAFLLKDETSEADRIKQKQETRSAMQLFASPAYRTLIMVLFLVGLAIAPINNLKIIVFENVGGSVRHIGLDSFVGALTQVPFIAMAALTQRLAVRHRFRMMAFFPFAMILLTYLAVSPSMVIAGTCLYNIGYGILLPTMRDVTENHVKKELRNFGHNLSDAVFNSFSGIISLMYAGAVSDTFGTGAMLCVCLAVSAAPLAISFLYREK